MMMSGTSGRGWLPSSNQNAPSRVLLNGRLESYLQQVVRLQSANRRLERQIQEEQRRRCPADQQELEGLLQSTSLLQEQITLSLSTQGRLKLQILAAELSVFDLNTRCESERAQRHRVEEDLSDLRLLQEALLSCHLPRLQEVLEEQQQELQELQEKQQEVQKRHCQDWEELVMAGGLVTMEMQRTASSSLIQQMELLRKKSRMILEGASATYWAQVTFDPAASSLEELLKEVQEELRRRTVHLRGELRRMHSDVSALEACGRRQCEWVELQLLLLQQEVDSVSLDLDSVLDAAAQLDTEHQMLLDARNRLEVEILDYQRLLDTPRPERFSGRPTKATGSSLSVPSSSLRTNWTVSRSVGPQSDQVAVQLSRISQANTMLKRTVVMSVNSLDQTHSFNSLASVRTGTRPTFSQLDLRGFSGQKLSVGQSQVHGPDGTTVPACGPSRPGVTAAERHHTVPQTVSARPAQSSPTVSRVGPGQDSERCPAAQPRKQTQTGTGTRPFHQVENLKAAESSSEPSRIQIVQQDPKSSMSTDWLTSTDRVYDDIKSMGVQGTVLTPPLFPDISDIIQSPCESREELRNGDWKEVEEVQKQKEEVLKEEEEDGEEEEEVKEVVDEVVEEVKEEEEVGEENVVEIVKEEVEEELQEVKEIEEEVNEELEMGKGEVEEGLQEVKKEVEEGVNEELEEMVKGEVEEGLQEVKEIEEEVKEEVEEMVEEGLQEVKEIEEEVKKEVEEMVKGEVEEGLQEVKKEVEETVKGEVEEEVKEVDKIAEVQEVEDEVKEVNEDEVSGGVLIVVKSEAASEWSVGGERRSNQEDSLRTGPSDMRSVQEGGQEEEDTLTVQLTVTSSGQSDKSSSHSVQSSSNQKENPQPSAEPQKKKARALVICPPDLTLRVDDGWSCLKVEEEDDAVHSLTEANAYIRPVEKYLLSTRDQDVPLSAAPPRLTTQSNQDLRRLTPTDTSGHQAVLVDHQDRPECGGPPWTAVRKTTDRPLKTTDRLQAELNRASGQWMVYGSGLRRAVSPTAGTDHSPLAGTLAASSPPKAGRFSSGQWIVYGGGVRGQNRPDAEMVKSDSGHFGRKGSGELMVSRGPESRSPSDWTVSRRAAGRSASTDSQEVLRATSPPETGCFGRRGSADWIVTRGPEGRSPSDWTASSPSSPPPVKESSAALQFPLSPQGSIRTAGGGSGEWTVHNRPAGRMSVSSERGGSRLVVSPPGSYTGRGSNLGPAAGSRMVRRSSSVGSGGRLGGPAGTQRVSGASRVVSMGSAEGKPVYGATSGRRSIAAPAGSGWSSGGHHRAPSPAERWGVSGVNVGGLSSTAAGGSGTSRPRSGSSGERTSSGTAGPTSGSSGSGRSNSTGGRVISSSDRPIRSSGSGAGARKERISVCKMAAMLMSAAGRERSREKLRKANRQQQQQQSAVTSPLMQRWLTNDVGVASDPENVDDIIGL